MSNNGTVALWRFDETIDAVQPRDEVGNVADLASGSGFAQPPVVDAALGRGRRFLSSASRGLFATDKVAGATLLQRDMSVQAVLWFDVAAQAAHINPGLVYCRGKSTAVAEYVSAALELRAVNVAAGVAEVRWWWQDSSGNEKVQVGGFFAIAGSGFVMLTATRRWVSSTRVVLRYYLGDQLISEVDSSDGDIGGGTTGTTQIGGALAFDGFLDGIIDELRVVDYELAPEEIAATFQRITVDQPRGYAMLRQLHDPGSPISQDPASRVQRETRQIGHALGYAVAQAKNGAANLLPDRAYGPSLARFEGFFGIAPKPGDSIDKRRARVLTRFAELGATDAGIRAVLADPLDTAPENLQIKAYTGDTYDSGASLAEPRWFYDPPPAAGTWAVSGGAITVSAAAEQIPFTNDFKIWKSARMSLGGAPWPGYGARAMAKITLTTFGVNGETGLWIGHQGTGNYLIVSLKYAAAGTVNIATEFFLGGFSQGQVIQTVAPIAWTTGWLRVIVRDDYTGLASFGQAFFTVEWSTTAEAGPYTSVQVSSPAGFFATSGFASLPHGLPSVGMFLRSTGGGALTATVGFQDIRTRSPHAENTVAFLVYRDPTLPGSPDLDAASALLNALAQAHTVGRVTLASVAICDDPNSMCDRSPCS